MLYVMIVHVGELVFANKQCRSIDCQFLFLLQIRFGVFFIADQVWCISCKCLVESCVRGAMH